MGGAASCVCVPSSTAPHPVLLCRFIDGRRAQLERQQQELAEQRRAGGSGGLPTRQQDLLVLQASCALLVVMLLTSSEVCVLSLGCWAGGGSTGDPVKPAFVTACRSARCATPRWRSAAPAGGRAGSRASRTSGATLVGRLPSRDTGVVCCSFQLASSCPSNNSKQMRIVLLLLNAAHLVSECAGRQCQRFKRHQTLPVTSPPSTLLSACRLRCPPTLVPAASGAARMPPVSWSRERCTR